MRYFRQGAATILLAGLIALVGPGAQGARADYRPGAAAVQTGNGAGHSISGRPQKNATIKGSPKPNSNINGSQIRGKH